MRGFSNRPDAARDDLPAAEGTITDASTLSPGQRVIYPGQGVCEVSGTEEKEIAGQKLELIRLVRIDDGAAVFVPRGKVATIGLRRLPSADQVEGVFHYLGASYDAPELDWKTRHRDNADRLLAGGVLGVAEVVKGLHGLSNLRPLPTKEREIYDHARHLLVSELSAALAVPPGIAEDYVDYALVPPPGVKFDLKPPPPPVLPPSRARPRRAAVADDLDDLGLGDLDLGADEEPGAEEPAIEPGKDDEGEAAPEEAPLRVEPAKAAAPKAKGAAKAPRPAKPAAKKGAKPHAAAKRATAKKDAAKGRGAKKPARGGKKR